MVRPSKNPTHAMLRVEKAMKPGGDTPQGQQDDQRGCGVQQELREDVQHERPSR